MKKNTFAVTGTSCSITDSPFDHNTASALIDKPDKDDEGSSVSSRSMRRRELEFIVLLHQ